MASTQALPSSLSSEERRRLLSRLLRERGRAAPRHPASEPQQRVWFLCQLDPTSTAYHLSGDVELKGRFDVLTMQRALDAIVARHDALRTHFGVEDGQPVQIVSPDPDVRLQLFDLSDLPEAERGRERERLLEQEFNEPFDLATGPLLRGRVLRLADDEHFFRLTIHHIVADGWSVWVLAREVWITYMAMAAGTEVPLPELPVQYPGFARWQSKRLEEGKLDASIRWWTQRFSDRPAPLELPTDRPRPPVQTFAGAEETVFLSEEATAALDRLGRQAGTTLFSVLLSAYAVLLQRYTGRHDITVGTVVANRSRVEFENVIGLFANTLPLRMDLSPEHGSSASPVFREVLLRAKKSLTDGLAHQAVPLERIIANLNPDRDWSRMPLIQTLLVLRDYPRYDIEAAGLEIRSHRTPSRAAMVDLEVTARPLDARLQIDLKYNTDLFDASTIRRLARQYARVLEHAARAPDRPIAEIPMQGDDERRRMLVDWNPTLRDASHVVPVHRQFEAQAKRTPDAVALHFDDRCVRYAELDAMANRLAHRLRESGIGGEAAGEDRVAILLPRSIEMVVALLATLKAGGAYVPLDPEHPRERLSTILRDADVRVLLTLGSPPSPVPQQSHPVPALDAGGASEIALDELDLTQGEGGDAPPPDDAGPNRLAYVIYTSGSTGRPKGVMIEHGNLATFFEAMDPVAGAEPRGVWLAVTTVAFDISVLELLWTLTRGFEVVIQGHGRGPLGVLGEGTAGIGDLITRHGVTHLQCTPSLARVLATDEVIGPALGRLRRILIGGDILPADLVPLLRARTDATLWNVYGPTETTVWSTAEPIGDAEEPVTIGRPLANTVVCILDGEGAPTPIGVPGELWIGGHGVGRGYHRRKELSAEHFVDDPVGEFRGVRFYRTGDRARWRADGRIEFLGRADNQIKLRGFRVEPGEIEALLAMRDDVAEAVVLCRSATGRSGEDQLVAFVVPANSDGAAPSPEHWRRDLAGRLPDYMVPNRFEVLSALPLTPNGKVDRAALGELRPAPRESAEVLPPRFGLEIALAHIWERVLSVESVGVHDDFFDLGGHSLLAVRLRFEIEQELGISLPLFALLRRPRLEDQAQLLLEGGGASWNPLVEIEPGGDRRPLFLTHPAGGHVFGYVELARAIGRGVPVYGLQARGIDGEEPPHASVEEMAACYVDALREVQPRGPYQLAGLSLGGVVAFEMAQRLRAAGEEVSLLAMLDTVAPDPDAAREDESEIFARLLEYLGALGGRPVSFSRERLKTLEGDARIEFMLEHAKASGVLGPGMALSSVETLYSIFRSNLAAMYAYRPAPYGGRVTVLRAAAPTASEREIREALAAEDLGWGALCTEPVDIADIPGGHLTMLLRPNVFNLAEALVARLDAKGND